jgi:hypothetical protein
MGTLLRSGAALQRRRVLQALHASIALRHATHGVCVARLPIPASRVTRIGVDTSPLGARAAEDQTTLFNPKIGLPESGPSPPAGESNRLLLETAAFPERRRRLGIRL